MRNQVTELAQRIEFNLQRNDKKKPWGDMTQNEVYEALSKTLTKLTDPVCKNEHDKVIKVTVDLVTYGLFMVDNANNLKGTRDVLY